MPSLHESPATCAYWFRQVGVVACLKLPVYGEVESAVCDIIQEKSRIPTSGGSSWTAKAIGFPALNYKLAELKNLDAVFTATPWKLHTPVMIAAMQAGKYGGTEMPACDGYDQAWELVNTSEKTKIPCMLLENYTYMRNVKMVLNMVRQGLFGDLTHCETGYQHDTRYVTISSTGELLWRAYERVLNNTGNRYPTHAIGPVAQWTNINRGNRFEYLVSMSSRSLGLKHYAATKFGPDHPTAKMNYKVGDVNTSLIQTNNGITITLYYDSMSPDLLFHIPDTGHKGNIFRHSE